MDRQFSFGRAMDPRDLIDGISIQQMPNLVLDSS